MLSLTEKPPNILITVLVNDPQIILRVIPKTGNGIPKHFGSVIVNDRHV